MIYLYFTDLIRVQQLIVGAHIVGSHCDGRFQVTRLVPIIVGPGYLQDVMDTTPVINTHTIANVLVKVPIRWQILRKLRGKGNDPLVRGCQCGWLLGECFHGLLPKYMRLPCRTTVEYFNQCIVAICIACV